MIPTHSTPPHPHFAHKPNSPFDFAHPQTGLKANSNPQTLFIYLVLYLVSNFLIFSRDGARRTGFDGTEAEQAEVVWPGVSA